MKIIFTHAGTERTLAKHPVVQRDLRAGTISEKDAAAKPWYLRYTVSGRECVFKLPAAERDAIRAAKDILNGHKDRPAEFSAFVEARAAKRSTTIGALGVEWIKAGLPFRKTEPRTPEAAKVLLENFNRALPWWQSKHVATVTPKEIEDYAGHRTPALRGADLELAALSCLCKWAVFCGQIERNPFEKRPRFSKVKQHCHEACPDDDEALHKLLAYMFEPVTDAHHQKSLNQTKLAAGTLTFCALTGLRPGEPAALLRLPPLAETPANTKLLAPGTIFRDRAGVLRMKVQRLKRGQNPFVTLHPTAESFLSCWRAWLARNRPDETHLFPLGTEDQTTLNRAMSRACAATGLPHFKPHAMRAYYVKVRRAQGEDDAAIAGELGQSTNGELIRSVYGDPQDLHGGQLFDWLPEDSAPAWTLLNAKAANLDTDLIRPNAGLIR